MLVSGWRAHTPAVLSPAGIHAWWEGLAGLWLALAVQQAAWVLCVGWGFVPPVASRCLLKLGIGDMRMLGAVFEEGYCWGVSLHQVLVLLQATASNTAKIVLFNVKQFWKGGVVGPAAVMQPDLPGMWTLDVAAAPL